MSICDLQWWMWYRWYCTANPMECPAWLYLRMSLLPLWRNGLISRTKIEIESIFIRHLKQPTCRYKNSILSLPLCVTNHFAALLFICIWGRDTSPGFYEEWAGTRGFSTGIPFYQECGLGFFARGKIQFLYTLWKILLNNLMVNIKYIF